MKNLFLLSLALAAASQAGTISYDVSVNTSAVSGQSGNLDFQFNGGNTPYDPATATISLFSTNGILGSAILSGDVTPANAQLPASFSLNNTQIFNDLFQAITFGSHLQFRVTFSGTALTSPSGSTASGSAFLFSLYDAAGINPLLTSDGSGGIVEIDVNQNATTTAHAFPNGTGPSVATVTLTPEPAAGILLLLGTALVGAGRRFTHLAGRRG